MVTGLASCLLCGSARPSLSGDPVSPALAAKVVERLWETRGWEAAAVPSVSGSSQPCGDPAQGGDGLSGCRDVLVGLLHLTLAGRGTREAPEPTILGHLLHHPAAGVVFIAASSR